MIFEKKIVALCTSRIYDPEAHLFIEKLGEALRSENIGLFIYTISSDLYWNEDVFSSQTYVFDLIPYDKVDYIVFMDEKIKSRRIGEKIIARASDHSVPVVVIDGHYKDTVSVCFDFACGFEKIVRHMIEYHNVRRPHFMAGIKDNYFSDQRIGIFRKVISENGIPFDDSMISYGDFWALPAKRAMQAVIDRGDSFDAVICANDIMAINVAEVLKNNGISVPGQVLVSGFDGYDDVKYSDPKISTMNCRIDILAETAAELIVKNTVTENIGKVHYVIPQEQYDESCGCICCDDGSNVFIDTFNDKFYRYQDDITVFHEITVNMQISDSPEKAVSFLSGELMHDMCCIADRSCFVREKHYFAEPPADIGSKELCVIYDSYAPENGITPLEEGGIVPDMKARLDSGYPLIFSILDFLHKPLGYVCYTFRDYNITDYSKVPSISNAVSMGLGGFINMRYQKYLSDKLEEVYKNDSLTGLYNRTAFNFSFNEIKNDPSNYGKTINIIMADLDGLKFINDNFGHDAGDIAISTSASALRNACPPGALLLRFGGDEMIAVILGECDEKGVLDRIEDYLKNFNRYSDLPYKVAASCGYYRTVFTEDFEFEAAVKLADEKMYSNKKMRKSINAK